MRGTSRTLVAAGVTLFTLVGCERESSLWGDSSKREMTETTNPHTVPPVGTKESATHNEPYVDAAVMGAGARRANEMLEDPGDPASAVVTHARARLVPTQGNKVQGNVTFTQTDEGVQVKTRVKGLPEGRHGYHVHLFGDCSSTDGKSAGGHFNFAGSSREPGAVERITGNLGELEAGKDGTAEHEGTIERASLQGAYSLIGRSVVVHEKGNDPRHPPLGAAGSRLACGVIGVAESSGETHARAGSPAP